MLPQHRSFSRWLMAFGFVTLGQKAQAALAYDCAQPLVVEQQTATNAPPTNAELTRIWQIQYGTEPQRARAFESLYESYEQTIRWLAIKNARLLNHLHPGSIEEYSNTLLQAGRGGLLKAALRYDLQYPKPARYLVKSVRYHILLVVITRDGRVKRNKLLDRMGSKGRALFFANRLEDLLIYLNALNIKTDLDNLKDLYRRYAIREMSLNVPTPGKDASESSAERIDFLRDSSQSLDDRERVRDIGDLMKKAIQQLQSRLEPRDLKIAQARVFDPEADLNGENENTLDALGAEFGLTKERVRQIEVSLRAQLKAVVQHLLVSPEDFLKDASARLKYIGQQRLFTARKEQVQSVARKLGLSVDAVVESEAELRAEYEEQVRDQLRENYLNSDSDNLDTSFLMLFDEGP